MSIPATLHIVPQRPDTPDCGVACLASYLGLKYERVLVAAAYVQPVVLQNGLSTRNLIRVAKRLGHTLTALSPTRYSIDDAAGIVEIIGDNHFALLYHGVIVDLRDPTLWVPDVFLEHRRAKLGKLLVADAAGGG